MGMVCTKCVCTVPVIAREENFFIISVQVVTGAVFTKRVYTGSSHSHTNPLLAVSLFLGLKMNEFTKQNFCI